MDFKRALLIAGRIGLGVMFLYSGYAKLSQPWLQFAVSIESFKLVPDNLLEPMARGLPWLEVATGLGVLLPVIAPWCALLATLMLTVFTGAGVSAYSRGLAVDCGCFGSGGGDPIGPKWFAEHGAMILLGLVVTAGAFLMPRTKQREVETAEALPAIT
jgi:uncharacterized membrane protein YphA (DoxX/SURF4 family)